MDTSKMIQDLLEEKRRLDRVIAFLETVDVLKPDTKQDERPRSRGRKSMSAAERQEVSERMTKYWATRREQRRGRATSAPAV